MHVARLVPRMVVAAAAVGLLGAAAVGCSTTIDGRASIADGVRSPATSGAGGASASATDAPSGAPTSSPAASPSTDPVQTKERVTCVLVQATIKSTNDSFNAAKTRDAQITVLKGATSTIQRTLTASGLPHTDKIYRSAGAILTEVRRIVASAEHGGNPSTGPYNTLTTRFRTACLDL